ncbi:MAG: 2Fe-2S iron-sulfur cluster binding domain-containing protein [Rhizobium sp.]|nr:2Fe-2S iron-sulfur cluster binding domain-containing protein [Rhizobium sp.]
MMDYYHSDKAMHHQAGRPSVAKPSVEEVRIAGAGLRDIYGTPSEVVRTKVYDAIGPGGLAFIDEACFLVLASVAAGGDIEVDLCGGGPMRLNPTANRQSFQLDVPAELQGLPGAGECAIIATVPGRCEALRMNGPFRRDQTGTGSHRVIDIAPDEIFFHCSAALTRSRIWAEPLTAPWSGQRQFVISDIRDEAPEVRSFLLRPSDSALIGEILPGQYLTIAVPQDASQPPRRRNYSVSGRPGERDIRITVRRISADGVSGLLHSLAKGDLVLADVPAGRFVFGSPPQRPAVLVSAGVGITPLLPMMESIVAECAERDVWFVHAARDARHHLFAEEARRLAERSGGRVRLFFAYSRPSDGETCDHRGRIDADVLQNLVPVADADFYICGPEAFMASLRQGLIQRGARDEDIHTEAFGAPGESFAERLAGRPERRVKFLQSGKEAIWRPSSGSLLDLALDSDVSVQYSCRNGDCHSCIQKLVSGTADYPAGEVPVLAEGQLLLCQAVPVSDMVIRC